MIPIKLFRPLTGLILLAAFGAFVSAQDVAPEKFPLSADQLATLQRIRTQTEKDAVPVAIELAKTAKEIFANMLDDNEDQKLRRILSKRLHLAAGRLLDIKGQSYRDMLAVLTVEQKSLVRSEMAKPDAPADIAEVLSKVFHLPAK